MIVMPKFDQQLLFEREEAGNFKHHTQSLSIRILSPWGELPIRVSLQIDTTEIDHPLSFRFTRVLDIEDFAVSFIRAYIQCVDIRYPHGLGNTRKALLNRKIANLLGGSAL